MHEQIGVVAAVLAVALGGCLTHTTSYLNVVVVNNATDDNPFFGYAAASLTGELLAMLALVRLDLQLDFLLLRPSTY